MSRTPAQQRELVLGVVGDAVSNLLYYDRKESEDLPVGAIDELVTSGVVTVDEIVAKFRESLIEGLTP